MKKKMNILLLALIVLCAAAFIGYRMLDSIRTDNRPPEISVSDPTEFLFQGIRATDSTDGDVTDSLVVENVSLLDRSGRILVTYAAFDSAGNVAKAQREAVYTDYTGPRFTLSAPLLYRSGLTFDILSTVGATDLMDGDIQHRIRATSLDDVSISSAGTHDVQFQVSNSLGDTATVVLPVEVYDSMTYTATLSLKEYLVYLKAGDSFDPEYYLDTFTLAGVQNKLSGRLPFGYSLQTVGDVRTETPGVYTLQYYLTYTEYNETNPLLNREYTGYSKLIVVVEG